MNKDIKFETISAALWLAGIFLFFYGTDAWKLLGVVFLILANNINRDISRKYEIKNAVYELEIRLRKGSD